MLLNLYRRLFVKLLSVIALAFSANTFADAPVWKVSKGDKSLFIGGSIHLLSEQDYPLPSAFELAFNASEHLVFETDIDGFGSVSMQANLLPIMMYQDGRTIKSVLNEDTHHALETFLVSRNLPIPMFERFTPAGLNLTLLILELQKLGVTASSGVESYLHDKAKNGAKQVFWLESLEEQLAFIAAMNELDADQLVRSTLRDINNLETEWSQLVSAWRSGNIKQLERLVISKMLDESPELYGFLLADRNSVWLPQIVTMLNTPEVEFIVVGALHLAGKDSILSLLHSQGYDIEQLD